MMVGFDGYVLGALYGYRIVFAHPVSIWESYKIILGDSQLMRDHPYDHMNQLGDSCPYKGS